MFKSLHFLLFLSAVYMMRGSLLCGHTDQFPLMLPFPLHVSQVTMWNLETWKCSLLSTVTKYREYAKIMATACVFNVMMGRHPMAAVPPHAHTQPHAHQGAAPKPHNVMLQQPRASG